MNTIKSLRTIFPLGYPKQINGHVIERNILKRSHDPIIGLTIKDEFECLKCGIKKDVRDLFNDFNCGENPDTSIEAWITAHVEEKENDGTHWIKRRDSNKTDPVYSVIKDTDIEELPIGTPLKLKIKSMNDRRTKWKIIDVKDN